MKNEFIIKCPVCNHDVEWFDICDKCNYQNSGPKEKEGDPTGPNKMTLREAKEAYKKGKEVL
ncbi:MAG: CPCC family cysteine-rich protein [Peptostreptococcaceae bacterium]